MLSLHRNGPREALLIQVEPSAWVAKEFSRFAMDGERLSMNISGIMEVQKLLLAAISYSTECEPNILSQSIERVARERSRTIPMTVFSLLLVIFLSLEPIRPFGRVLGKARDNENRSGSRLIRG